MFISIFDQYGTFFLILLGVIVLLCIGYFIFSRPRKVKTNETIVKKKVAEVHPQSKSVQKKDVVEQSIAKQSTQQKLEKEIVLEPAEFSSEDIPTKKEELNDSTIGSKNNEINESQEDLKKIDELIEAERDELELEENYDQAPLNEPDAKEHLKHADKLIDDLISKSEEPKELGKYHVLYRKEDSAWYIKREGSEKITKVLPTQKEAIAFATIKAINQKTSVVIHKRDGKIRKQTY